MQRLKWKGLVIVAVILMLIFIASTNAGLSLVGDGHPVSLCVDEMTRDKQQNEILSSYHARFVLSILFFVQRHK